MFSYTKERQTERARYTFGAREGLADVRGDVFRTKMPGAVCAAGRSEQTRRGA